MLDRSLIQEILPHYKEVFKSEQWWADEKFKWQAVKTFQDHWDPVADDFPTMLRKSLSGTRNLLVSANKFPEKMITEFADNDAEAVRSMFAELFDESQDVFERIDHFKHLSAEQLAKHPEGHQTHYQDENTQSIYLWLRYPDRYFLYKWGLMGNAAQRLGSDLRFKRGAYEQNIRNYLLLGQEITDILKADQELNDILFSRLDDTCYPDPEFKTLTGDFIFYLATAAPQPQSTDDELAEDFEPDFSVDDWVRLLNDPEIFTPPALELMKRTKDFGGEATRMQLANRYGKTYAFYNSTSSALARRIAQKHNIARPTGLRGAKRWWPILYTGRVAESDEEGSFVWKLHENLSTALEQVDLEDVPLYASEVLDQEQPLEAAEGGPRFWWLNANPKIWSFSDHPLGEEQWYSLYNENGNKRRIFQNFLEAKPGDWLIGYESTPRKEITALGRITRAHDGNRIYFEKIETLLTPIPYSELKAIHELDAMEYFQNNQGSLFQLTENEYEIILDLIRERNPVLEQDDKPPYSREEFLTEVFMAEDRYDSLVGVLKHKKNLILQGAPGVGKTFAAKRLAYSIMGEKDDNRIEFIQFHQNYSYEEFVMGYRPSDEGFELKNGIFYDFCRKASNSRNQDFFFIIDEINRGNLSKIFGELLMLIENDYRGETATLAYNGAPFTVPPNIHIIGMMNTADRSLAMIDYALRRRFSFFEMEPGFSTPGFQQRIHDEDNGNLVEIIRLIERLNADITQDPSLGRGFRIGHSYFLRNNKDQSVDEWLKAVIEYDIIPMLEEYWFDDEQQLQQWENEFSGVLR